MGLQINLLIERLLRARGCREGTSDAALLERFSRERDETAFETLLWRHGPMVLATCRRILHDEHAAEDAFQATFFVLACKATSISRQATLPGWLHRVAHRIAVRAQRRATRQRGIALHTDPCAPVNRDPEQQELQHVLDEEIERLPEKYRLPFVLCYLQGVTNEQAARQLACPMGTVATRLAWARQRLQERLRRRGMLGAILTLSPSLQDETLITPLVQTTSHAATAYADNQPDARLSARAVSWSKGELRTMRGNKLLFIAVVTVALGIAVGAGNWIGQPVDATVQASSPTEEKTALRTPEDVKREQDAKRELELERLEATWQRLLKDLSSKRVELRLTIAELRDQLEEIQIDLAESLKHKETARANVRKAERATDPKIKEAALKELSEWSEIVEKFQKSGKKTRRDLITAEENLSLHDLEQERHLERMRRQVAKIEGQPAEGPGSSRELERKVDQLLKEIRELKKQK